MPGSPSPPEVLQARVDWVKGLLVAGPDTSIGFIGRICAQFSVSKATASVYLTKARREIGDAVPLDGDEFDAHGRGWACRGPTATALARGARKS